HAAGAEPDAPFLAVNCAAIPNELLENQLFGHVRGAFTGADRDRTGLFAAAGRGTVFLDEIGELPLATQAKLLRAIEMKEVLPVGATRSVAIGARVLAATNKDLATEVAAGTFRADLYYRLNVVAIALPPLRDRREDIPDLISVLLSRHADRMGRSPVLVDNATTRRLSAGPWKGNVRELDNALERAMILAESPVLTWSDFPPELVGPAGDDDPDMMTDSDDLRSALDRFERAHIRRVLDRSGGDKREAARRLGLGLSSLYRKLDESGTGASRS
ncbi:MAG TPA: sigma-54 dependent transcriptional regulator, partial [Isosphaeraceae bacterium]